MPGYGKSYGRKKTAKKKTAKKKAAKKKTSQRVSGTNRVSTGAGATQSETRFNKDLDRMEMQQKLARRRRQAAASRLKK
jgi:hypothetical protein